MSRANVPILMLMMSRVQYMGKTFFEIFCGKVTKPSRRSMTDRPTITCCAAPRVRQRAYLCL
jgi:hypothetical protein